MHRTTFALLFLGCSLVSCATPNARSGQPVSDYFIAVRAPSHDWQARYDAVVSGEQVVILLSNATTKATIDVIDFRPTEGTATEMADMQRATLLKSGKSAASIVYVSDDGSVAGFQTFSSGEDGEVSGGIVFVRRASRPDMPIAFVGRWPPEHDKAMSADLKSFVDSLTIGR